MGFRLQRAKLKRRLTIAALTCASVGYFSYHAFHGQHGIFAEKAYIARVETLKTELAGLTTQRQDLEHHIALLSADRIDPDMLEERVRDTLNMAHPRDVVIMQR